MTIGVIDLGTGNISSVANSLDYWEISYKAVTSSRDLEGCSAIIFPGVGAFGDSRRRLLETGLDESMVKMAERGIAILGICLGMQLLGDLSDEHGQFQGLGLIPGVVKKISWDGARVPHMGWNAVTYSDDLPLFDGIPQGSDFYFTHSFYFDADEKFVAGRTEYGVNFTSVVCRDSVVGVQFHPEKSQRNGLQLIRNFCEFADRC